MAMASKDQLAQNQTVQNTKSTEQEKKLDANGHNNQNQQEENLKKEKQQQEVQEEKVVIEIEDPGLGQHIDVIG